MPRTVVIDSLSIFMCSATKIGPNKFRLFYGAGDGNVGTGIVSVSDLS